MYLTLVYHKVKREDVSLSLKRCWYLKSWLWSSPLIVKIFYHKHVAESCYLAQHPSWKMMLEQQTGYKKPNSFSCLSEPATNSWLHTPEWLWAWSWQHGQGHTHLKGLVLQCSKSFPCLWTGAGGREEWGQLDSQEPTRPTQRQKLACLNQSPETGPFWWQVHHGFENDQDKLHHWKKKGREKKRLYFFIGKYSHLNQTSENQKCLDEKLAYCAALLCN